MNKSDFVKENGFFRAEFNGISFSISDSTMSDEVLQLAGKILLAYPQKVTAIAEHISQDEWIANTYKLSKEEIADKLHKPSILLSKDGGQISYCENEIDFSHILDLEFSGVLDVLYDVGMDG